MDRQTAIKLSNNAIDIYDVNEFYAPEFRRKSSVDPRDRYPNAGQMDRGPGPGPGGGPFRRAANLLDHDYATIAP